MLVLYWNRADHWCCRLSRLQFVLLSPVRFISFIFLTAASSISFWRYGIPPNHLEIDQERLRRALETLVPFSQEHVPWSLLEISNTPGTYISACKRRTLRLQKCRKFSYPFCLSAYPSERTTNSVDSLPESTPWMLLYSYRTWNIRDTSWMWVLSLIQRNIH